MPNSRIEFAVSATPIAEVSAGENVAVATIGKDIGKTLGGSGSVDVAHTTAGYANGSPSYVTTTASGVSICSTAKDFLFIKNPGIDTNGNASSDSIVIKAKMTGDHTSVSNPTVSGSGVTLDGGTVALTKTVCTLAKGQAVILPMVTADIEYLAFKGGSTELKVEYVTVD